MLAITKVFDQEDALKALTMLEQLALPVELNATLEPAADFAKASTVPATGGGPAGASLGIGVQTRSGRRRRGRAIDAVVRLDAPLPSREVAGAPALFGHCNDDSEFRARLIAMGRA